jgi:hypothetical protein
MRATVERHRLTIVLTLGIAFGMGLYGATSSRAAGAPGDFLDDPRPGGTLRTSPGAILTFSGFDPLTGLPHGWTYTIPARTPMDVPRVTTGPVPTDMQGRWAIPLPLGFTLGVLAGLAIVSLARRFPKGSLSGGLRAPT